VPVTVSRTGSAAGAVNRPSGAGGMSATASIMAKYFSARASTSPGVVSPTTVSTALFGA
jgi:hypothetical protein